MNMPSMALPKTTHRMTNAISNELMIICGYLSLRVRLDSLGDFRFCAHQ